MKITNYLIHVHIRKLPKMMKLVFECRNVEWWTMKGQQSPHPLVDPMQSYHVNGSHQPKIEEKID